MALGAKGADILRLVTRQSMILVMAGAVAGTAGGLAAGQLLKRVLFSVDPTDPKAFLTILALLTFVAILACLLPARRALSLAPTAALRSE